MITDKDTLYDFDLKYYPDLFLLAEKAWIYTYLKSMDLKKITERLKTWYSEENHKGIYENVLKKEYFFKVLYRDQKMIGFVSGKIKDSTLDRLYIDPELIGQGIRSFLIDIFIEELIKNNKNTCIVYCDKKNEIGLSFYMKKEFKIIDEDEEDYKMILNSLEMNSE